MWMCTVLGSRAVKWIFKDDAPRVVRLAIGAVPLRRRDLVIDFRMADCRSPRGLGLSDDARCLGLGLRALKILDGP